METIVKYLLASERFTKILNEGINPFYSYIMFITEFRNKAYSNPFSYSLIDLEKSCRIFELLLQHNQLYMPKTFLHELIIDTYNSVDVTYKETIRKYERKTLLTLLNSEKANKCINTKTNDGRSCLDVVLRTTDDEEIVEMILQKSIFPHQQINSLSWLNQMYSESTSKNNCTATKRLKSILKILTNDKCKETSIIKALQFLLRDITNQRLTPKDELIKKPLGTDEKELEKLIADIIESQRLGIEDNIEYEQLIFLAATYGKINSFSNLLLINNKDISKETYELISKYAIFFYRKNYTTIGNLNAVLDNYSHEELTPEEALTYHINMYFLATFISEELKITALANIISYFKNAEEVINCLDKLSLDKEYKSSIAYEMETKDFESLDKRRIFYESHIFRCYHPITETDKQKLYQASLIATHLLNEFTTIDKKDNIEQHDKQPKSRYMPISRRLKRILASVQLSD